MVPFFLKLHHNQLVHQLQIIKHHNVKKLSLDQKMLQMDQLVQEIQLFQNL